MDLSTNIIAQLGLQEWPEEKRRQLVESLTTLIEKRVMLRLLEQMDETDLAHAESLSDDPEKLLAFFGEKYPELGEIFNEEIAKVREELPKASGADRA